MASIFDSLSSAPGEMGPGYQSIYDNLLAKRQMLEQARPEIAAQLPSIGGAAPGERMMQAQQAQPAQDIASTLQQAVGGAAQKVAGPDAKPKDVQAASSGINDVFSYLDPLKPKQVYGPDLGKAAGMPVNSGGILGLGIQPIDLLAFSIGAALTRNMPQAQAMATTFKIAGMPSEFRKSQEENAQKYLQQKMEAVNSEISGGNLQMRQLEAAGRAQELFRKQQVVQQVSQRLATGKPLSDIERQLIAANGHGAFDPSFLKEFVLAPNLEQQYAAFQKMRAQATADNAGNVGASFDGPGGMKLTVGAGRSSGRPLTAGELADALATGRNTERLTDSGYDVTTPAGRAMIKKGLSERRTMEQQRLAVSITNSDRAQSQFEAVRPEESKKLTALQDLHRGASDMMVKYEAALKSHGGKFDADVQTAMQAATTSPEGIIGKSIQALGQRYPKLTQSDLEFISRYASIQKFARGSLNDVGNLSNYERGIFQTMVGTPLDKPELFRSRTSTAINDAAIAYDQEHRSIGRFRNLSEFPRSLGEQQQAQPQQRSAAPTPTSEQATHTFDLKTGKVILIPKR